MPVTTPVVSTSGSSGITLDTATLAGFIVSGGGEANTLRGFQISTIPYANDSPDGSVSEEGSFGSGEWDNITELWDASSNLWDSTPGASSYSLGVSGLTPDTTYYFRAFSTNSAGSGYGEWLSFVTSPAHYSILINGVERVSDIILPSLQVSDQINDQQNSCTFTLDNRRGVGFPTDNQEIVITMNDDTVLFAGYIVSVTLNSRMGNGVVMADISCIDYSRLLDSNLVHRTYEAMTDKEIIEDIVATCCVGFGITTTNVIESATIDQISFNYVQPSQCLRKLAELTSSNWFIGYDKDIHYFPLATTPAPFDIDSTTSTYTDLKISKDSSQIKNRVYVRGGTKLSDFTTYSTKGDGTKKKFVVPDKPHDTSITVNGVSKTVGVKNIDISGFDYYLNFQEKYLEQDVGATVLSTTDVLIVTYKYDIPILVAVENTTSILAHGQKEFAIFDKSITTTDAARARATAEITDYASSIVEGSFTTMEPGFISGQYMHINLSDYDIDDDYIIQKVSSTSLGSGLYEYSISIASSKTMGIIKFLIELLEANRNLVELDDSEVVDELFSLTDSLLTDSLVDSLIIDSSGPYFTWAVANETTPITTARWDLFSWG